MSKLSPVVTPEESDLVIRSVVKPGLSYAEYRNDLRRDFFHSCAYCTISEAEGSGIRFTIDHYEPQEAAPQLVNEYSNLMYACDPCNILKGPRTVPAQAQADGIRFYRADMDSYSDHFERIGLRLRHLSKLAEFTIDAVELNRQSLRRLREIRARLYECDRLVTAGIRSLKMLRVDALPPAIRKKAMDAIAILTDHDHDVRMAIEEILRDQAHSPMIDDDPDKEESRHERKKRLKGTEALYPGSVWRG